VLTVGAADHTRPPYEATATQNMGNLERSSGESHRISRPTVQVGTRYTQFPRAYQTLVIDLLRLKEVIFILLHEFVRQVETRTN
jgi:hypothetical protein